MKGAIMASGKNRGWVFVAAVAVLSWGWLSCSKPGSAPGEGGRPVILVSIAPQKYFVEQVAGTELFDIEVIIPDGQSPHSYEPSPRQLVRMQQGVLWFTTGVEFEKVLMAKLTPLVPSLMFIDTTKGVTFRRLEAHDHGHEDGDAGEEEGGLDPHVWMGIDNVSMQAGIISEALGKIIPERRDFFAQKLASFRDRLSALKADLAAATAGLAGKPVFVYHPAFGYLLDELGLKQEAVELEGKDPGARQVENIIKLMKDDGAKVLFVQKQFPSATAKKIADAVGGVVAELDPLSYDWENNLRTIASTLSDWLRVDEVRR